MRGRRRPCDYLVAKLSRVADLSAEDEEAIHAVCRNARDIPARQHVIQEGDKPDHVHIMVEGWAARSKTLAGGVRQITAFLLPGDFVDLHVTILGQMDHDIVALTDAKIAHVPHQTMQDLPRRRPELGRALWWATLVDEATLREWIVNIGRRDAYQRVAHLFCELHARLKLVGLADDDRFTLPLIELRERMLAILDVAGLREAAGFDPSYLHRGRLADRAGIDRN